MFICGVMRAANQIRFLKFKQFRGFGYDFLAICLCPAMDAGWEREGQSDMFVLRAGIAFLIGYLCKLCC